jgi:hypothetical protein
MTGTTDRGYLAGNEAIKPRVDPARVAIVEAKPVTDHPTAVLVTLDTTLDDLPLGLFHNVEDAVAWIEANPPYSPMDKSFGHLAPPEVKHMLDLTRRDVSSVHGYSRYNFENGKVTNRVTYYWPQSNADVNPWPTANEPTE